MLTVPGGIKREMVSLRASMLFLKLGISQMTEAKLSLPLRVEESGITDEERLAGIINEYGILNKTHGTLLLLHDFPRAIRGLSGFGT